MKFRSSPLSLVASVSSAVVPIATSSFNVQALTYADAVGSLSDDEYPDLVDADFEFSDSSKTMNSVDFLSMNGNDISGPPFIPSTAPCIKLEDDSPYGPWKGGSLALSNNDFLKSALSELAEVHASSSSTSNTPRAALSPRNQSLTNGFHSEDSNDLDKQILTHDEVSVEDGRSTSSSEVARKRLFELDAEVALGNDRRLIPYPREALRVEKEGPTFATSTPKAQRRYSARVVHHNLPTLSDAENGKGKKRSSESGYESASAAPAATVLTEVSELPRREKRFSASSSSCSSSSGGGSRMLMSLRQDLASAETGIRERDAVIERLKDRIGELLNELEAARSRRRISDHRDELKAELDVVERGREEVLVRLSAVKAEKDEVIGKLREEVLAQARLYEAQTLARASVELQLAARIRDVNELKERLVNEQDLERELVLVRKELKSKENHIQELESRLSFCESKNKLWQQDLAENEMVNSKGDACNNGETVMSPFACQESKVHELMSPFACQESKVHELEERIQEYQKKAEEVSCKLEECERELQRKNAEAEEQNRRLNELAQWKATFDSTRRSAAVDTSDLEEQSVVEVELKEMIDTLEDSIEKLDEEKEDGLRRIQELQDEVSEHEALKERLRSVQEEKRAMEETLASKNLSIERVSAELEVAVKRIQEAEKLRSETIRQLEEVRNELVISQEELELKNFELIQLSKHLAECKGDVKKWKSKAKEQLQALTLASEKLHVFESRVPPVLTDQSALAIAPTKDFDAQTDELQTSDVGLQTSFEGSVVAVALQTDQEFIEEFERRNAEIEWLTLQLQSLEAKVNVEKKVGYSQTEILLGKIDASTQAALLFADKAVETIAHVVKDTECQTNGGFLEELEEHKKVIERLQEEIVLVRSKTVEDACCQAVVKSAEIGITAEDQVMEGLKAQNEELQQKLREFQGREAYDKKRLKVLYKQKEALKSEVASMKNALEEPEVDVQSFRIPPPPDIQEILEKARTAKQKQLETLQQIVQDFNKPLEIVPRIRSGMM